jgi:hypothetical protein
LISRIRESRIIDLSVMPIRRGLGKQPVWRINRRRNPPFAPRSIGGLRVSHAQFARDHVIGEEQVHKPIHDRWFTIANLDVRFHGESPSCELEGRWRRVGVFNDCPAQIRVTHESFTAIDALNIASDIRLLTRAFPG